MNYEINFLILQSKTADLPTLRQKVKEIIQAIGGKISEEKEYAKRKLAYKIQKESYGFHTVLRFSLENPEKLSELKKNLNLEEKIARYLIVKTDQLLALSELEEKLKKASEEKTHLSQEELGQLLKEKNTTPIDKNTSKKTSLTLNQTMEQITEKREEILSIEEKKEVIQPGNVKELTPAEKKAAEDKKLSMDELDKKLDEILNI